MSSTPEYTLVNDHVDILVSMIRYEARDLVLSLVDFQEPVAYDIMHLIMKAARCTEEELLKIQTLRLKDPIETRDALETVKCLHRRSRTWTRWLSLRLNNTAKLFDENMTMNLRQLVTRNPLTCVFYFCDSVSMSLVESIINRFYPTFGFVSALDDLNNVRVAIENTKENIKAHHNRKPTRLSESLISRLNNMLMEIRDTQTWLRNQPRYAKDKQKFDQDQERKRKEQERRRQEEMQELEVQRKRQAVENERALARRNEQMARVYREMQLEGRRQRYEKNWKWAVVQDILQV